MLPVSPVAGGAFPTNDTGGQRGRQDPLSTSLLPLILPAQPSVPPSLHPEPPSPSAPPPPPSPTSHSWPDMRRSYTSDAGDRDSGNDWGRGVTTATMPGETSDGGGEDINGGQGRHIESLSLIFAQRRCEFFLLARKVAAQGWCLGLAYGDDRSRGYHRHPCHPLSIITETLLPSLCAYVRIFMFSRVCDKHGAESPQLKVSRRRKRHGRTMHGYARRKRITETRGNRACMIARDGEVCSCIGRYTREK